MSDELTAAALLGTDRTPGPHHVGDDLLAEALGRVPARDDPAIALLDVAALAAAARRASATSTDAGAATGRAPTESRQPCSPAAAARLRGLLVAGKDSLDLLELWLVTAARNGRLVPPGLLVHLLDAVAGVGDRDVLRAHALVASGERGRWLAEQNPAWRRLAAAPPPEADMAVGEDDPVWAHGSADARAAWLRAARSVDPAGARGLVASAWSRTNAEERAAFVRALQVAVTPDDEEFLTAALSDRSAAVRAAAVQTLAQLPSSALVRRCTERALACVTVTRRLLREQLVMELPEPVEADPFVAPRAGAKASAQTLGRPPGVGAKADLLTRLVELVPLSAWTAHLGREPRVLVQLATAADAGPLLHGWAAATEREHDATWAHALLDSGRADSSTISLARMLAPGAQLEVLRAFVRSAPAGYQGQAHVSGYLSNLAIPWTDAVTEAAGEWIASRSGNDSWAAVHASDQLGLAAPPTSRSESAIRASAALASENVSRALTRAADTVHQRRLIIEELT